MWATVAILALSWLLSLALVMVLVRSVTTQVERTTSALGSTICSTVERLVGGPEPAPPEGLINQHELSTEKLFSPPWLTEGAYSGPNDADLEGPPDLAAERGI